MAEITYEVLKEALAYRNVPILTLNQRWYQLVPEISKTDEIRYWEGQVNELLKRQGQVTNDLTDVKKIKSQLIQDVVENMEEDSSSKHKKRMNKNQKLIHEAKEKILQLEDEEKEIPKKLAEANHKLLIETAKMCFDKINENNKDLEVLNKWIDATRVKLKRNLLIKQDKEETNNQLYAGMHNILGAEVMRILDKINDQ